MSTDYSVACHTCRKHVHIGQRFTSGWAFGWGSQDTQGQRAIGEWMLEHLEPDVDGLSAPAHDVRIHESESVPESFERTWLK